MTPPARKTIGTVMHITPSLGGGGAEAMLCNLLEAMRDGPWRQVVVAVKTGTRGCQAARIRGIVDAFYDLDSPALLRPAFFAALRRIIRQERPDVVQTWMHHADLVGGLAARFEGVKRIVWGIHMRDVFRSPSDSDFKIRMFKTALRAASRSIPRLIVSCSTAAIADHERELGYPRKKMSFIANGISTTRFVPDAAAGARTRTELGIPLDVPVIGFVGRFHPIKNLSLLFSAAARLQERMGEARFVLCGGMESDLDPRAAAAFATLRDKSAVHFLPFRFDMERLYPAFSLQTLCSESEALPMVVIEAMACGVPCVTTDVGDCREVIADTGRVVPPGDPEALARAWQEMLELPSAERNTLSQKARQRAEAHFSLAHAAAQYQSAYRELLQA